MLNEDPLVLSQDSKLSERTLVFSKVFLALIEDPLVHSCQRTDHSCSQVPATPFRRGEAT